MFPNHNTVKVSKQDDSIIETSKMIYLKDPGLLKGEFLVPGSCETGAIQTRV